MKRTAFILVVFSLLAGCRQAEQIRTFTVPKEPKVEQVAAPAATGEPTDRMLTAVLPAGGQAWFFKVVGKIPAVDKREKEVNEFFSGLTLADDGRARWKLPAGWKEEAGSGMRAATIVIPGDERLEITVSAASWPGTQESLLANVNRWRGQLQLPPIGPKQLGDVTRESKAGERTITIVDLRGQFKSGGMTPPFAGGGFGTRTADGGRTTRSELPSSLPAGHPPIDSEPQLPAGHPPVDSGVTLPGGGVAPNASRSSDAPKFVAPASWKTQPATGFRKADFAIEDGDKTARVTLTDFPANEGPMIADPLSNINRWRGEVGLAPIDKDALGNATESMDIDGQPATFAAMIPDAAKTEQSKAAEASLAAIVRSGDRIWFIKMKGSRDLVAARQDEFKTFLKSFKFSKPAGANDGNK